MAAIPLLDFRWAILAALVAMSQIPLVALRWRMILDGLAARTLRMTDTAMVAITAIGVFFVQVLPSAVGEGVRAWRLGRGDLCVAPAVTAWCSIGQWAWVSWSRSDLSPCRSRRV
jgi:hypothetical protein